MISLCLIALPIHLHIPHSFVYLFEHIRCLIRFEQCKL